MQRTIPGGFLVALEGIDGAGKSSLVPALGAHCTACGLAWTASREPTNGPWGRRLRESAVTGRLPLEEELELFLRDREEHVAEILRPRLAAGEVVILDRYYFSTAAYQGARGADPEAIIRAHEAFAPVPALVLLLDLDPAAGLSRVRARGDQPDAFEREQELAAARRIFLGLKHPRLVRLSATQPAEQVRAAAVVALEAALRTSCQRMNPMTSSYRAKCSTGTLACGLHARAKRLSEATADTGRVPVLPGKAGAFGTDPLAKFGPPPSARLPYLFLFSSVRISSMLIGLSSPS